MRVGRRSIKARCGLGVYYVFYLDPKPPPFGFSSQTLTVFPSLSSSISLVLQVSLWPCPIYLGDLIHFNAKTLCYRTGVLALAQTFL